jgi:hypothetical protein
MTDDIFSSVGKHPLDRAIETLPFENGWRAGRTIYFWRVVGSILYSLTASLGLLVGALVVRVAKSESVVSAVLTALAGLVLLLFAAYWIGEWIERNLQSIPREVRVVLLPLFTVFLFLWICGAVVVLAPQS